MKQFLTLALASASLFAFKPYDTHPTSVRLGVHTVKHEGAKLNGYYLSYEKVVPHDLYLAAELGVLMHNTADFSLNKFEGKIGYTAFGATLPYVTPFVSLGFHHQRSFAGKMDHYHVGAGAMVNIHTGQFFNAGAGLQLMKKESFKNSIDETTYGWESFLSLKFFPETLDLEVRPMLTKWNNLSRSKQVGAKFSVGYCF